LSTVQINAQDQDLALIDAAMQGNTQAFERLYLLHHGRIYALCLRMTANTEAAEECTQEAFINAWRKLSSFRKESRFSTWLHTLASRVTLDYLRKHKSWLNVMRNQNTAPEPGYQDHWHELSAMDKLLIQLPEITRVVFTLHSIEGYRHTEISKLLSISENTSRAHVHQARQQLQEWINND
jgi:RNA polymerase sigma-70 factor (ECF subfamily)